MLQECTAGRHAGDIQVIDVREPAEFSDALGRIAGARLLPLSDLSQRMGEIDRSRPVVTVCRSGARSGKVFDLAQQAWEKSSSSKSYDVVIVGGGSAGIATAARAG